MNYDQFLENKRHYGDPSGFDPGSLPSWLYDFQSHLVRWSIRQGRSAIFADCGLGKTPMQLVWSQAIVEHENKPCLIIAPLAVSHQITREADKFGIEVERSIDGKSKAGARIIVTNYERLHFFDPAIFSGVVCDESSILKNFDGIRRAQITEFMRRSKFRLLCTATAAPNDYIELGTSSEALGEMGHMDMLTRFFRNVQNNSSHRVMHRKRFGHDEPGNMWRFKGHAEQEFWRWVCSWARAIRRPSDLGYDDSRFVLPELIEREHVVSARSIRPGMLFDTPAQGLTEQREERSRTIKERCEKVAELVSHDEQCLVWCQLNPEGDLLEKLIPGAVQVAGSDSDECKEERLIAFQQGQIRVLVTKPKIGAWGLNLQNCAHVTFFPSHSYEQYYQGVRRCWRFGQTRPVIVDVIGTEGARGVSINLKRKAENADRMFSSLVAEMNHAQRIDRTEYAPQKRGVPAWIANN